MNLQMKEKDILDTAIRESLGGRLVSAGAGATARAWSRSVVGRLVDAATTSWRALDARQKIRAGALAGAVAMVIHRAMALLGRDELLGGILPAVVLVLSVAGALLAGPIAREWERFRR